MPGSPLFDRNTLSGDRSYATSGDTAMLAGQALTIQRLIKRARATPGSNPLHPDWGCGLGDFVEATIDDTTAALIDGRIRAQFPRDPVVLSVDDVSATRADQQTLLVIVSVTLTADQGGASLSIPISIH